MNELGTPALTRHLHYTAEHRARKDGCGYHDGGQTHKTTIIQRHSNLASWLNHASQFRLKTEPILNI